MGFLVVLLLLFCYGRGVWVCVNGSVFVVVVCKGISRGCVGGGGGRLHTECCCISLAVGCWLMCKRSVDFDSSPWLFSDNAYACDPRIQRFKEEEKEKKLAQKRAKQEAARQRAEEEEKVRGWGWRRGGEVTKQLPVCG